MGAEFDCRIERRGVLFGYITLTAKERVELVLRLIREEASAKELAKEASISERTLLKWRDEFMSAAFAGLDGLSEQDALEKQHARELAKRDQVIGELTVAMRVLEKLVESESGRRDADEQIKSPDGSTKS